jgi:hypothetical protein
MLLRNGLVGSVRPALVGWSDTRKVSPERRPVAAIGVVEGVNLSEAILWPLNMATEVSWRNRVWNEREEDEWRSQISG